MWSRVPQPVAGGWVLELDNNGVAEHKKGVTRKETNRLFHSFHGRVFVEIPLARDAIHRHKDALD